MDNGGLKSIHDFTYQREGIKNVGMVESQRHIGDKITSKCRYFIYSLKEVEFLFSKPICRHGASKRSFIRYWMLASEKMATMGNEVKNMATAGRISVNMLKQETICKQESKVKCFKRCIRY